MAASDVRAASLDRINCMFMAAMMRVPDCAFKAKPVESANTRVSRRTIKISSRGNLAAIEYL